MTQIELTQRALSNSIEALLNAEAQVQAHLEWIAEAKRLAIIKKVEGKQFRAGDIIVDKGWRTNTIDKNAIMKVISVTSSVQDYNLVSAIRDHTYGNLIYLSIYFLQNPQEILDSKMKLTEAERKILKEMLPLYKNFKKTNGEKAEYLNRGLMDLKHKLNISYQACWSFHLDAILVEDFIERGVRCNNTILK